MNERREKERAEAPPRLPLEIRLRDAMRGEAKLLRARARARERGRESGVRVLGRARLLALARRDEGETRIDRYPPASCALIAIPALVFARTLFPSVRYSPSPPSSPSSSSSLSPLSRELSAAAVVVVVVASGRENRASLAS